jgi:BirA family biotin operon repressor/biotin-[acetyl-CoA-carboxylase] ligase
MSDALSLVWLQERVKTEIVGRQIELHAEIASTNGRAVELARSGAAEGLVVVAEHQTAGKGRLGRRWHALPGSALLFSLLLRPPLEPSQAQRITMLCALAAIEAIQATCGVQAAIKWPNDLVVGERKLGGVLTELGLVGARLAYGVVGMGINVNLRSAEIPEALTPPTSLLELTGAPVERGVLLARLLAAADARYARLRQGWSPHAEWRAHLSTLGQPVQVGTPEEVIAGVAEDVDADGALLVRTADGALRTVLVGDVTLRGHRVNPGAAG